MRFTRYIKDKINYILGFIVYCIIIVTYSNAMQIDKNFIIVITILSFIFFAIAFWLSYRSKNNYIKSIEEIMNGLEEKYLISEIISTPDFMEGRILKELLNDLSKSMIENVNNYKYQLEDYKEFIELWIHEIKMPIATSKMIIENNKNKVNEIILEINKH